MTLLEQRYRFVLRMLPASYRAEREEEMVDAYLDSAGQVPDEDNPRPSWREVASVAALAVRTRAGGLGAAPRYRAMGDAVRLVALLGLGFHAVLGWYGLVGTLFSLGVVGSLPAEFLITDPAGQAWQLVSAAADLVGIAAFATLALGRVRAARILAYAGLLFLGVTLAQELFVWERPAVDELSYLLVTAVPAAALLLGQHRDAPVRRSSLLAVLPLGLVVLYVAAGFGITRDLAFYTGAGLDWMAGWIDPHGLSAVATAVAGVVCLARKAPPAWSLALAVVAALLGVLRAPVRYDVEGVFTQPLVATWAGQAAGLLLLAAALAVVSVRALPRAT
ncbi:hypothetical protein [Nonomuraea sp. NPDC003754]